MSHKSDYWEDIRRQIIPKIGVVTQFIEDVTGSYYYVKSETHNNRFVGRVDMHVEDFEVELHKMGFERNPLSSWKHITFSDEKEYEEGSFRKVGFDNFPRMQLHVILYDGNSINNPTTDVTYVYAHWEYRWDVHPIKHYRGKKVNGPEGVRRMKKYLDEYGVNYEPIRP